MLTIAQKKEAVSELRDKFARAKGIFVADYSGLDVEAVNQLRRSLRAEGEGDYEGLAYVVTAGGNGPIWQSQGLIYPGRIPPMGGTPVFDLDGPGRVAPTT